MSCRECGYHDECICDQTWGEEECYCAVMNPCNRPCDVCKEDDEE